MSSPPVKRWIKSGPADTLFLAGPLAVAAVLAVVIGHHYTAMPLWGFLLIVVGVDVAHVWATLYRTYFDRREFSRRRLFYLLSPPLLFAACLAVALVSLKLFWSILAYVAIYHFISQQYGLVAVYKYRLRENEPFRYRLDKGALYAAALGPMLWWHSGQSQRFDWFGAGEDFFFRFDLEWTWPFFVVSFLPFLLWLGSEAWYTLATRRPANPGKWMVMTGSWVSWWLGIYYTGNAVLSAAFINLFHGIPFLYLTWLYCNGRFGTEPGEEGPVNAASDANPDSSASPDNFDISVWNVLTALMQRLARPANLTYFAGIVISLALVEELLWDLYVWGRYLPGFFSGAGARLLTAESTPLAVMTSLLILPQVVHYFYDGFLWKARHNPGLLEYLGLK